jgi:UDP-N-acetylglucosamine transferase subunit ALG13
MKIKIIIVLVINLYLASCAQETKKEENEITKFSIKNKDLLISKINTVLIRQIQFGNSVSNDVADIKYYEFSVDDIEILEDECSKILISV